MGGGDRQQAVKAQGVELSNLAHDLGIGLEPGVAVQLRAYLQRLARRGRAVGQRMQDAAAVA